MNVVQPVEPTATRGSVAPQKFPWRSVSKSSVEAANAIIGKRRKLSFKLHDDSFWFRFVTMAHPVESVTQYTLQFADDAIFVSLFGTIPEEWINPAFRGLAYESLPPELQEIVLEASVASLLELLGSLWGKTAGLTRGIALAANRTDLTAFSWEAGNAQGAVLLTGTFLLPPVAVTKIFSGLRSVKPEAGEPWELLPYPVSVEVGSTVLSWRDFRSLQNNDVVLLDEGFSLDKPDCLVLIGDQKISAKRTGKEVTTSGRLASLSSMANSPAPQKTEAISPPVSVEDLPVRLSFTVGDAELTFRDLKSLQEGHTFVINRPVTAPVQIRAQGTIVGVGELLMVGDQIGVRVIELHLGT